MACYENKTKEKCARIVLCISIILFIMGLFTCIMGIVLSGDEKIAALTESEYLKNMNVEIPASSFAIMIILGGLFVILTSILGCLTGKMKKFFFTIPFMIMTMVMGFFTLIVGLVFLVVATDTMGLVEDICTKEIPESGGMTLGGIAGPQYNAVVGQMMCSGLCPCSDEVEATWTAYGESFFTPYNRTLATSSAQPGNDEGDLVMMVFSDSTNDPTYDTFLDCYEQVIVPLMQSNSEGDGETNQDKATKEFFDGGGADFVSQFETTMDCASICETPLFYLSLDVSLGAPTQDCMIPLMEGANQPVAGGVALFTGLICLIAFCASFPLCSGFSEQKDMMGEP